MAKGMPTPTLVKQPSVPSLFTCPISLELMLDPVTLSTGQTYDRNSIEKWFESGHSTCPSTMQVISCSSSDIAPNRTLQRLIHSWCVTNNYSMPLAMSSTEDNSSHRRGGADHHRRSLLAVVSSKSSLPGQQQRQQQLQQQQQPRADLKQVQYMLQAVARKNNSSDVHRNLKKLRSLSKKSSSNDQENRENRKVLRDAGAIPTLTNFVFSPDNLGSNLRDCEEALGVLLPLLPSSSLHGLRKAVHFGSRQLTAISWLLNRGSLDGRVNAALFLASLTAHDAEMKAAVGATAGVFEGLVQLLKEELYPKAMESGLKAVLAIIGGGGESNSTDEGAGLNGNGSSKAEEDNNINVVRCVRAGMVCAVAELLPEAERRNKVRAVARLMELLCSCAEGREAAMEHALVVPVLVRIVSLGDANASQRVISCLWSLCRHFPEKCLDEVAGQVGILTQLSQFSGTVNAATATAIGGRADSGLIDLDYKQRAAELLQQLRRRLQRCDHDLSRTNSGASLRLS